MSLPVDERKVVVYYRSRVYTAVLGYSLVGVLIHVAHSRELRICGEDSAATEPMPQSSSLTEGVRMLVRITGGRQDGSIP